MSFTTEKLFWIASMNADEPDETPIKPKNQNRNKENRRQIIDFIADNGISDAKSISKAIGLKLSRTRDYLKQLVDEGIRLWGITSAAHSIVTVETSREPSQRCMRTQCDG